MANEYKIQQVLDYIRANQDRKLVFNMSNWVEPIWEYADADDMTGEVCGTAQCFAGWAMMFHEREVKGNKDFNLLDVEKSAVAPGISTEAALFLELDEYERDYLFTSTAAIECKDVHEYSAKVKELLHDAEMDRIQFGEQPLDIR